MSGYRLGAVEHHRRLRKIEGQVRGIQRMIDDDRYCIDVLDQIAAVRHALDAVALGMVDDHVRHCVVEAAAADADLAELRLTDALHAMRRLLRT